MKWLLLVIVCNAVAEDCHIQRAGRYLTKEHCERAALGILAARCVREGNR